MNARSMALIACLSLAALRVHAQSASARPVRPSATPQVADTAQKLEVYGFGQADAIYEFKQSNPDWFDVNRPSRLPAFDGQYGRDGRSWLSARQSRLGVKGQKMTTYGMVNTQFDFDMFGVGPDQGQHTIRLRHAWGQLGQIGGGQLESPFMDLDVFPNIIEYWGPNGMLFFRNVMIFWQPVNRASGTRFTLAVERPGASGDLGVLSDRVELSNVTPRFPLPDFSGEWRVGFGQHYVELAGIVRSLSWDDNVVDAFDLSGSDVGWGVSLSSNIKWSNDVLRVQGIYGEGVENYFNDAPIDVGPESNIGDPVKPVRGKALADLGVSIYLDHNWNSKYSSAIGWSIVDIDNSDLQDPSAYRQGQYASTNLLYQPTPQVLFGGEFQWANRKNFSDGFSTDNFRLQFSVKYMFSQTFGAKP